jgi:LysM repeat protein
MARLGEINLHIEKESESHKVDATMYAVEKGEPFTDHVAKRPSEFSLSGLIISDDWDAALNNLKNMMEKGEIVKYVGKMIADNVIITDLGGEHGQEIKNGASVRIGLRRIRITRTAYVKAPPKQKPARKPVTEAGKKKPVEKNPTPVNTKPKAVYHVVRKGDTYWALAKKYGTTVQKLRDFNKYPDRQIPVGVKLRIS